jgi:hypothetical protein
VQTAREKQNKEAAVVIREIAADRPRRSVETMRIGFAGLERQQAELIVRSADAFAALSSISGAQYARQPQPIV